MQILGYTLACLIACIGGTGSEINSKPNSDFYHVEDTVEEYFVEHEISAVEARNAVQQLDLKSDEQKVGCQQCTRQEIRYCLGLQLMNDHCCCDKKYSEFFPYVPHTCYIGQDLCKPLARDCAEYTRLRICCCDKYTLEKWKLMSKGPKNNENLQLLLLLTTLAYFVT